MALLKFKNTQPPGGFSYFQKETKLIVRDDTLIGLVNKVISHRSQRELGPLDFPTVQKEVERQICTRLNREHCQEEGNTDEWVPIEQHAIDLSMIGSFSRAALSWIASGGDLVPKAEAERRANICRECPLNSPVGGCNCDSFYKMVNKTIPEDRKLQDIHICHACACSLQAKVNLPLSVVKDSNGGRKLDFPVFCWQLEAEPKKS